MRKKYKFKQLLNQYRSLEKELKNIREIMRDLHYQFEDDYRWYCSKHSVDTKKLNKDNSQKVAKIFEEKSVVPRVREKLASQDRDHSQLYKDIARKIHPDKVGYDDPRYPMYEEDFKKANNAANFGLWGDLFDIADKYSIDIRDYDTVIESLQIDIKRVKKEIHAEKSTYSWKLFNCDGDHKCRENVIRDFLKQVFGV
jgi:hypothetical protein